jgi:hypothetical protein
MLTLVTFPLHGDPPPDYVIDATYHYGRAYVLVGSGDGNEGRVFWSDPDNPESWYTQTNGNWFILNTALFPTALGRTPGGLVVFCRKKIFFVEGRSPSTFILREITPSGSESGGFGTTYPNQIIETPYGVFFFDWDNRTIFQYSGGRNYTSISEQIEKELRSIPETEDGGSGDFRGSFNLFWMNKYGLLLFSYSPRGAETTSGLANKTWLYDPIKKQWVSRLDYGFACWAGRQSNNTKEEFIAARSSASDVSDLYTAFSGVTHGGSTITPVLGVPTFTNDQPHMEKTLHFIDVLCHPAGTTETVKVDWFIDGATTSDGNATITMTGTDSRERHRVYIGERGREFDIDLTLDDATGTSGVYGVVFGFTIDTSVTGS